MTGSTANTLILSKCVLHIGKVTVTVLGWVEFICFCFPSCRNTVSQSSYSPDHFFLLVSPTVHGSAAAQPASVYFRLWLGEPFVCRHHAQCGSAHHANHQIHWILQKHLHPPWKQRFSHCGLLWRRTGESLSVQYMKFFRSFSGSVSKCLLHHRYVLDTRRWWWRLSVNK